MVLPALALSAQRPEQILTSMQIQANKAHACFERRSPSNRFFFFRTFSPKSERAHLFQRQATVDILALDGELVYLSTVSPFNLKLVGTPFVASQQVHLSLFDEAHCV